MSLVSRVVDAIRNSVNTKVYQEQISNIQVNALCSAYENLFAQVRPLVEEMEIVVPYGVGANGAKKPLSSTSAIQALLCPNDQMDWYEFADAMFVAWLTLPELNIHVHRRGKKIIGYTILPAGCRRPAGTNGHDYDTFEFMGVNRERISLTPDEVATLRFSRNPLALGEGVSPASSVFVWSQIDDLMAQYQKAYLENGAVPAHITIIRASTREGFERKRKDLERGLKGAKNRNKTVYIWRQQLDDGTTGDEMEVKTIQGNNSSLAIKELISVIDNRLNKAVGVSNFILGDDSSAKYDNAELSDHQFTKRRVYPALRRFWGQFQHELDRIVGGLGYAIQFDLEIPELTERAKVRAEIKDKQADSVIKLLEAGGKPAAVCKALGLGEEWLSAAYGIYASKANTLPEAVVVDVKPTEIHHHTCDHHHHEEKMLDSNYQPVFEANEELQKKIYDTLMAMAEDIAAEQDVDVEVVKETIVDALMGEAQNGSNAGATRIASLIQGGEASKEEILQTIEDGGFQLSEDFKQKIIDRTDKLVSNFDEHTRTVVRNTLLNFEGAATSASQIKTELAKVMPRGRAEMIARNEVRYAFQSGRLDTDEAIADKYGFKVRLVWNAEIDDRTCEACRAMNGTSVYLGDAFPDQVATKDGVVVGWEHNEWNDGGREPNAHANCRCTFDEVFE